MNGKKVVLACGLGAALFCITGCSGNVKFEGKALEGAKVGEAYNQSVSIGQDGMTYELDYTDNLPLGLVLAEDGTITGTPEENGNFTFTIVAIDKKENVKEADFTLDVEKGAIAYQDAELPAGKQGEPYMQNIATATGMPSITYALTEGSTLPAGLELSETGELSGIPTEAMEKASFTVTASASGCDPVEAAFTLTVEEGEQTASAENLGYIVFEGATLPDGEVGTEYNQSVRTAYGVPNITYKVKYIGGIGFPKGLSFNKELGVISGTPTNSTSGVMRFNVIASAEGYESVTAEFQLRIYDVYEATNKMEAEHIDVSNLKGAGYSGSAGGVSMIQTYAKASGGRALGYLNTAATFSFAVESVADTDADVTLCLGTEWGDLTLTPKTFKVFINEEELDYGSFTILEKGAGNDMEFQSFTLQPSVKLHAGENIVRFEIVDSEDTEGVGTATAKGPIFDYLQIDNASCEIGWRPRVANTK